MRIVKPEGAASVKKVPRDPHFPSGVSNEQKAKGPVKTGPLANSI